MPLWIVSFIFALAAGVWMYTRLAASNGNADPKRNLTGAGLAALGIFVVLLILIKFVFNFE